MRRRYTSAFVCALIVALTSVSFVVQALPTQSIGTWAPAGTLPGAPTGASVVTLADGRTLVIGGMLPDDTPTNAVMLYDANLNALGAVGQLAAARSGHAAAVLKDGRVIVVGGVVNGTTSAEIEIFDPATGDSEVVATLTTARSQHAAAALLDGTVLIAGGVNGAGTKLADAEIFTIDSPTTLAAANSMSTARAGLTATTLLDGRVLIVGGNNGSDLASAELYYAESQTFDPVATSLTRARSGHSAVLLRHNGGVLIAGGSSDTAAQVTADLFLPPIFPDPFSYGDGSFVATGDMSEGRVGAAAGNAVEGYAFAAGGGAQSAEVYRFATVKTDKDDYAPGEYALITGTGWAPNSKVTLLFQEDPAVHEDYTFDVPTDGDGNFATDDWAPEEHDLNVRFYLTVTDGTSRAQTTFTDGRIVNKVELTYSATTITCNVPGSCTGNLSVPPDALISVKIFVTTTPTGNNAWKSTFWRVATTVPGTTTCVNHGDHADDNVQFNETFSITAPHDGGTYNAYFAASNNDTCAGNLSDVFTFANSITVVAANVAPVLAAIGDKSVNELAPLTFTATATDSDVPANVLTFSLDAGFPAGASITPGGAFSWTPTEAQGPGSYPVTVRVTDNGSPAASDTETITITVNEVNVPPVLNAIGAQSVDEGSLLSFTATATDADTPPNSLTFSLDAGAPAGAAITPGGAFTWTPTETQGPGIYPVTVRVADNHAPAADDFETINITVNEANVAPVLGAIGNQIVDEGELLSFTATATDADLPVNTLSFSLDAGAPAGATIDATTGVFSWTPAEDQGPGVHAITVRVTDNGSPAISDFETINVTVNEVNAAPVLNAIGDKTVNELAELTFSASATDSDLPANSLTYSLSGEPAGASINASTGAFSWTPTEAQGPGDYTFTVRVTDDGTPALDDEETITVTVKEVNLAPVLAAIGHQNVDEEVLLNFTATATDADVPANALTFSLDAGAPAGATIDATTGVFSWTPTEAQGPGVYPITVRVTDDGSPNLSDSETINVTVKEVNLAPVLGAIGDKTVAEHALLSFTATASDADVPANTLTFSLAAGAPAGAAITAGGNFSWTPTEAQGPGIYSITVVVTDNGAPALSDSETINVTVSEVNEAPVLNGIGSKLVLLGNTLGFTASATDADIPANTLAFSLGAGAPAGASINSATGAFTWTPTAAQAGLHSITVRVTDNGAPSMYDEETITVTVQYSTCLLYDATKSHKKGSTIPIKLFLCDVAGNNVSSPGTVVNATGVVKIDPSASSAVVDDSGNANPDFNFRYDAGLGVGGGYIFNLSTKTAGYNTGTWKVVFTVNGVAAPMYFAPFDIK
jgi:hypothetical protein